MSDRKSPTLLRPRAPEWATLGEEKRRLLTPDAETPVEELLRAGQQLSDQAGLLLDSIRRSNERTGPRT